MNCCYPVCCYEKNRNYRNHFLLWIKIESISKLSMNLKFGIIPTNNFRYFLFHLIICASLELLFHIIVKLMVVWWIFTFSSSIPTFLVNPWWLMVLSSSLYNSAIVVKETLNISFITLQKYSALSPQYLTSIKGISWQKISHISTKRT